MNNKGQIFLGALLILLVLSLSGTAIILKQRGNSNNYEVEVIKIENDTNYVGYEVKDIKEDVKKIEEVEVVEEVEEVEETQNEEIITPLQENSTENETEEVNKEWYEFNYDYWYREEYPYGEQICINWSIINIGEDFYYNSILEKVKINGVVVYNYGTTPNIPILFDERHDTQCLTIDEVDRIYISGSYEKDDLIKEFSEKIL